MCLSILAFIIASETASEHHPAQPTESLSAISANLLPFSALYPRWSMDEFVAILVDAFICEKLALLPLSAANGIRCLIPSSTILLRFIDEVDMPHPCPLVDKAVDLEEEELELLEFELDLEGVDTVDDFVLASIFAFVSAAVGMDDTDEGLPSGDGGDEFVEAGEIDVPVDGIEYKLLL